MTIAAAETSTKRCSKCLEVKKLDDFHARTRSKDGRAARCKACQSAAVRAHYQDNVDYYVQKARARRKKYTTEAREWVRRYLERHPCVDCGESDLRCLQFDHVRPGKIAPVGDLIRQMRPLSVVIEEIEKCDVRCANCHQKKTAQDYLWWNAEVRP